MRRLKRDPKKRGVRGKSESIENIKVFKKWFNWHNMDKYNQIHMNNYGTDITSSFTNVAKNTTYYKNNLLYGNDKVLEVKLDEKNIYNRYNNVIRIVKDEDGQRVDRLFNDDLGSPEGVLSWVDIATNIGFIRRRGNISIYYKGIPKGGESNYDIYNVEVEKKCPNIILKPQDQEFDNNFGSLDLETMTIDEFGVQQTYAGGWYIGENSPGGKGGEIIIAKDSKDNVIKMLIDSIFKYISPREGESKEKAKERDGLTLFAHNLGRFDGVEIIKGIIQEEDINSIYDLKGVWKTDQARLLSLRIKHKKLKCHINIHDSLSFFNFTSLDKVMKSYKIGVNKGIFPHSFIRDDNLEYIGNKPDKMYYIDNVTQEEYDLIPDTNWNLRYEINKYLRLDIEGLYKAV